MTKQQWLDQEVFVDEFGRPYNLSDVPMTFMTREKALKKQRATDEQIDELWEGIDNDPRTHELYPDDEV